MSLGRKPISPAWKLKLREVRWPIPRLTGPTGCRWGLSPTVGPPCPFLFIIIYLFILTCYFHILFKKEICFLSSFKYIYLFGCIRPQLQHQESLLCRWGGVGSSVRRVDSLVVARGPWSAQASAVAAQGLSCSVAFGILVPPPGIEPACPALQAEFLTTGPPEKPRFPLF